MNNKNYIKRHMTDEGYEFECCLNGVIFWVTEELDYNVEANDCQRLFKMFEQLGYCPFELKVNEPVFDETGVIYITFRVSSIDDIEILKSKVLNIYDFEIKEQIKFKTETDPFDNFLVTFEGEEFIAVTRNYNGKSDNYISCLLTTNNAENLFSKLIDKGFEIDNIGLKESKYIKYNNNNICLEFTISEYNYLEELINQN